MVQTDAIVSYTLVKTVNRTDPSETIQIAYKGVRCVGLTWRKRFGSPPSRANAKAMRDAEVTVARPHRYWHTMIPVQRKYLGKGLSVCPKIQGITLAP